MKTLKAILLIVLSMFIISCEKDNDNDVTLVNGTVQVVEMDDDNYLKGEWVHVYSYVQGVTSPLKCNHIKKTYVFGNNGGSLVYSYGKGFKCEFKKDKGRYDYVGHGKRLFLSYEDRVEDHKVVQAIRDEIRIVRSGTTIVMVLKRKNNS